MKEDLEKEVIRIAQKIIDTQKELNLSQLKTDLGKIYEKVSILSFVEKYYKSLGASESRLCYTSSKVASFIEEQQKEYSIFDIPVEATIVEPMKIGQIPVQRQTHSYVEATPLQVEVKTTPPPPPVVTPQVDYATAHKTQSAYDLYKQATAPNIPHQPVNQQYTPPSPVQPEPISPRVTMPLQPIEKEPEWAQYTTTEMNQINNPYISQTQQLVFDKKEEAEPKPAPSINDHFGKTVQIGLNDRLAFIRQLFFGSESEYNKVIQNINNLNSVQDIALYIEQEVKPIYNYWKGKEEYEERFLSLMLKRFEM